MSRRGITGLEVLGIILLVQISLKLAVLATGKREKCEWVDRGGPKTTLAQAHPAEATRTPN